MKDQGIINVVIFRYVLAELKGHGAVKYYWKARLLQVLIREGGHAYP